MEAIVKHNYNAKKPDELTLGKGDIIKNIKVLEGGWWEGTLNDKRGMFPDNFVKVLDSSSGAAGGTEMATIADKNEDDVVLRNGGSGRKWAPVQEEKQLYRVLFPYEAVNEDELTIAEGDIITLLSKDALDKGWWKGELKGKVGLFPDNFVELSDNTTNVAKEIFALTNGNSRRRLCKVLYSREPLKSNELKLVPNDLIEFLGEEKKGWYRGQLRGQVGIFRSNFVNLPIPENYLYKALYSYEAANKDELTIAKDEIITVLTKDVIHEGWWKGELNRKVGFFPSNYVISINDIKNREQELNPEQKCDLPKIPATSYNGNNEKEATKNVIGDRSKEDSNESTVVAHSKELDEVVKNADRPLMHLTASRAKPPNRRLPTTRTTLTTNKNIETTTKVVDEKITNDNKHDLQTHKNEAEDVNENDNEDEVGTEGDGENENDKDDRVNKTRRKAPWADEVILYYQEKQKKVSKVETPKEEEIKVKTDDGNIKPEEEEKGERETPIHDSAPVPQGSVSCDICNELSEKVRLLEENQLNLQLMINQLVQTTSKSNVQIDSNESHSSNIHKIQSFKTELKFVLKKNNC